MTTGTRSGLTRRQVLVGAGAGALALAAGCTARTAPRTRTGPGSSAVAAAESRRRRPDARTVSASLVARRTRVDLGGTVVDTWTYGGTVPGPGLRATVGDVLRVDLRNELPADTTVHWHGLALRNDMDGVPGVTQDPIRPGATFRYEFALAHPGTYWFHPHVGVQLDRGLYAPLLIDDPAEPGRYDVEFTVVLDDWLDGIGRDPDRVLADLKSMAGMDMGGMDMGGMPRSTLLGGDAGDVTYPHYVINGRVGTAPVTLRARPGQRARLRLVNAGGDTAFRLALGGHRLTVTHADGFPVRPTTVDTLLIGMGERYDVEVALGSGVFPLVALAEGKGAQGMALVRTAPGRVPPATVRPRELGGRLLDPAALRATPRVALPEREPDRTHDLVLDGGMMPYRWTINGRTFDRSEPLPVRAGEAVRLRFVNRSSMFHPIHVHGHTFQVRGPDGTGPRRDTVIVRPKETVVADLVADNPGRWLTHCHNIYHAETGMTVLLSYQD